MGKFNRDTHFTGSIRDTMEIFVELITNRHCKNCAYNNGLTCSSPKYEDCVRKIFPVGFKRKKETSDNNGE